MRRRQFLMLSSAVGGLATIGIGGAAYLAIDRYGGWIREALGRALPGYSIDPAGLALFLDEYNARQGRAIKSRLFAAAEGLTDAKAVLSDSQVEEIARRERRIVSDFLVGSDFFENYPDGPKTITYRGRPVACGSPFATF